jgi:hypothetical protein
MLAWLRRSGMLRRQADPEADVLQELFLASTGRYACPNCAVRGLRAAPDQPSDDWPEERPCQQCGTVIPAERLEVLPETKLCPTCQRRAEEASEETGADAFCGQCGGRLAVKQRAGIGLAGYRLVCSDCGRKE